MLMVNCVGTKVKSKTINTKSSQILYKIFAWENVYCDKTTLNADFTYRYSLFLK